MNYALIKDGKCTNIVVFDEDEKAQAFKETMIVDKIIDDMVIPVIGFGIGDNYINGNWSKQVIVIDLSKKKTEKISQSKLQLEEFFKNKPMQFKDGKYYSVTESKQTLLANAIQVYQMKVQAGLPSVIKWNATGEECTVWTLENITTLALAIASYVEPLVAKQQALEVQIRVCKTVGELDSIVIDYGKL